MTIIVEKKMFATVVIFLVIFLEVLNHIVLAAITPVSTSTKAQVYSQSKSPLSIFKDTYKMTPASLMGGLSRQPKAAVPNSLPTLLNMSKLTTEYLMEQDWKRCKCGYNYGHSYHDLGDDCPPSGHCPFCLTIWKKEKFLFCFRNDRRRTWSRDRELCEESMRLYPSFYRSCFPRRRKRI